MKRDQASHECAFRPNASFSSMIPEEQEEERDPEFFLSSTRNSLLCVRAPFRGDLIPIAPAEWSRNIPRSWLYRQKPKGTEVETVSWRPKTSSRGSYEDAS